MRLSEHLALWAANIVAVILVTAATLTADSARAAEAVQGVLPFSAFAETTRADLPPAASSQPQPYKVVASPSAFAVTILQPPENTGMPRTIPLLVMDNPPLHGGPFFIRGCVSYDIGTIDPNTGRTASLFPGRPPEAGKTYPGAANLELQSLYADGTTIFSRNDDQAGLMKYFIGQSDERPFAMTVSTPAGKPPIQLKLVLSSTATGSVTFHSVTVDHRPAPGLLLVEDQPAAAAEAATGGPGAAEASGVPPAKLDELSQRLDQLSADRTRFGRSFLVDEDERRLLQAERRLNEHVMANDWTQRFTIPLGMDVRTSWWFLVGAMGLGAIAVFAVRSAGEAAGAIRGIMTALGLSTFGWGMAALGRGLLAGVSVAAGGLLLLMAMLVVAPLLNHRRRTVELRRMELLDVA